jgi:hypothetical protein
MAEFRSKVTLRPRSKLERILDLACDEPTPPPTAEYKALRLRKQSEVAPSVVALRVAARLGYPGNEPAAIARALDAEVPEGDPTSVAWRAHYSLQVVGERWCHAEQTDCAACPVRTVCDYRGLGLDPAVRVVLPGPA